MSSMTPYQHISTHPDNFHFIANGVFGGPPLEVTRCYRPGFSSSQGLRVTSPGRGLGVWLSTRPREFVVVDPKITPTSRSEEWMVKARRCTQSTSISSPFSHNVQLAFPHQAFARVVLPTSLPPEGPKAGGLVRMVTPSVGVGSSGQQTRGSRKSVRGPQEDDKTKGLTEILTCGFQLLAVSFVFNQAA
ncbi:hypothetical protein HJG60_011088 [Phyllostomus discolor]|uniref:Uncharacterized protein n=1 Tax=Phyllostomus discolor TaxID=89673 RepID=A0A834A3U1_9CHIR|nr:hypothetical protein HJG60_011088 [Phyllostomus discolor]